MPKHGVGMAKGDRGVAHRAPVLRSSPATEDGKPGLPRHSFATAGGFGVVPLGYATDAPPCGRGASLLSNPKEQSVNGVRLWDWPAFQIHSQVAEKPWDHRVVSFPRKQESSGAATLWTPVCAGLTVYRVISAPLK